MNLSVWSCIYLTREKLFLEIIYKFDPNVFFSIVISFRKYRNDIKNAITESLFIKRASERERDIKEHGWNIKEHHRDELLTLDSPVNECNPSLGACLPRDYNEICITNKLISFSGYSSRQYVRTVHAYISCCISNESWFERRKARMLPCVNSWWGVER